MLAALFGLLAIAPASAAQSVAYGAYGPEGPRLREQLWIVPSGDPNRYLRATVFRPADPAGSVAPVRRPLVVINHGTSDWTRMAVSMPVFYWLSRWFVDRGYAVVLPQRRGHGATGGSLSEAVGTCAEPDHFASGQVAADDVAAVVEYMSAAAVRSRRRRRSSSAFRPAAGPRSRLRRATRRTCARSSTSQAVAAATPAASLTPSAGGAS